MEIRFLDFWDDIAADGTPLLANDHPKIETSIADRVSQYLRSAPYVDRTTALGKDEISGEDAVVPQSLRSDGRWVWSDEVAYYVEKYKLSPGDDFLKYISSNPVAPSELSAEEHSKILGLIQH